MTEIYVAAVVLNWVVVGVGCWLGWQILRQNGRMLLRLEELETRLNELEFGEPGSNAKDREARFRKRSLARSRIKRDGLKTGMPAPNFRLPRLEGGVLSLEELRGKRVLLIFSDPQCGPCQALAPHVEKFHRATPVMSPSPQPSPRPTGRGGTTAEPAWEKETAVVMISRGEPKENRAKVMEHGLTFPVLLQQRWEVSRLYAMFVTPIAYLIDEKGSIMNDVAVGVEPILRLMDQAKKPVQREATPLALDRKAEMC
jgi:peroxiredoxin